MLEKESTLEALRANNRKIKILLAQLKIPKIDALTLETPINLEFIDLIHEMVIIQLLQELSNLEIKLNLPNLIIGERFIDKISPLLRKKNPIDDRDLQPQGKEKKVLLEISLTPKQMMINCIIWNARGKNNSKFRRHCKSIVNIHQPAIFAFLEMRMTYHQSLPEDLGFPCQIQSNFIGNFEGIMIM